jgi:hypothetical protein
VYDETIRVMKSAVQKARLGRDEEMQALKRLDSQARRLEGFVDGPSLEAIVFDERAASRALDGRSVFGWERDLAGPSPGHRDSLARGSSVSADALVTKTIAAGRPPGKP